MKTKPRSVHLGEYSSTFQISTCTQITWVSGYGRSGIGPESAFITLQMMLKLRDDTPWSINNLTDGNYSKFCIERCLISNLNIVDHADRNGEKL